MNNIIPNAQNSTQLMVNHKN